jgi:hypothetical protein
MGNTEKSKRIRRTIRELVVKGYERELSHSLSELEAHFKAWRDGTISCFRLNELIHEHHDGVSRDLWKKYAFKPEAILPGLVAYGVILESEVPGDVLADMQPMIRAIREVQNIRTETPEGVNE